MTTPLTPDAALLLRRIIVEPRSELPSVHTATDRMTELVDELRAAKLVIMQGGKWVVTPPETDQWTAPAAVAKLRAVLVDGADDAESAALLTSWGVPMTVPFERVSDGLLSLIYAVPLRHFRVTDVLRLTPGASMRGERTPADEVLHWVTEGLLPAKRVTVHSERDGVYVFPEPSAAELDAALVELRADKGVEQRMLTELVMRGDAERLPSGTVVPKAPAPVIETTPVEPSLSDRIVTALGEMGKADAADLSPRCGASYAEVSRALTELGTAGRAEKVPGSLNWRLPSETPNPVTPKPALKPAESGVPAVAETAPTTKTVASKAVAKTSPVAPAPVQVVATPTAPKTPSADESLARLAAAAERQAEIALAAERRIREEVLAEQASSEVAKNRGIDVLKTARKIITIHVVDGGSAKSVTSKQIRRRLTNRERALFAETMEMLDERNIIAMGKVYAPHVLLNAAGLMSEDELDAEVRVMRRKDKEQLSA